MRWVLRTGWSCLRNTKQHLWYSCCQISLVISNMKFNRKLGEQFWRIWCFPIQWDRSCTCMPKKRFKDGRWVTWLALKGLWFNSTQRISSQRCERWVDSYLNISDWSLRSRDQQTCLWLAKFLTAEKTRCT